MNDTFNKHFVFHNLSMISKKLQSQEVNEVTIAPLISTLNRVKFSHLDTDDAKKFLDTIDFKVGSLDLPNSHFDRIADNISENPSFMNSLIAESKKKDKDSFPVFWTEKLSQSFDNAMLMKETADINVPKEPEHTRRRSMSM